MKPTRNSLFLAIALAMVLLLAAAWPCAAKVPDPTPIDLGVLPIYGHEFSTASAINNAGQVVGVSFEQYKPPMPFIWQNGMMTPLPLPDGSVEGGATSINDTGQVAGYCIDGDSHFKACLWTQETGGWVVTPLGAPKFTHPVFPDQEFTFVNCYAGSINNAGQIFASAWGIFYEDQTHDLTVLAIWQEGAWRFLTDSDGNTQGADGWLFKMNDNGQVLFTKEDIYETGYDLWVWDGETASELVKRIDWAHLNNFGQIAGRHYNIGEEQSVNFTYDIETKTLKTSPASVAGFHLVNINDKGQVLVVYPTNELGITSFADWSTDTASVTSLGGVDCSVVLPSLNFNVNGEVSGQCYAIDNLFYASEKAGVMPLDGFIQDDTQLDVTAMNDSGVIIGRAQVPDSGAHAVLWGEVGPPVSTLDILIDPPGPLPVNTPIAAGAYLSDLQTTDIHTAAWDWGDKNTSLGVIENGIVTGAHSYSDPGVYTVALEIFDSEKGLLSKAVYQYVVVYDPEAGFVNGGGWFSSPVGAYKNDPSLEGQATFGFVSRYKKGADVPTGNTAFEFAAGGLYFHSTSYEWLVVTGGDYAKFKGSGTINGWGDFKFMVWAGDGAPDTFRIKIWDELEDIGEDVIYDNGSDQAVNGGSIVIHTKWK
jgi:probable HAF family extracellular repeat protein